MNIYIGSQFLWLVKGKAASRSHKSLFIVILNIKLCSLDVNIIIVRTSLSDKGQEQR